MSKQILTTFIIAFLTHFLHIYKISTHTKTHDSYILIVLVKKKKLWRRRQRVKYRIIKMKLKKKRVCLVIYFNGFSLFFYSFSRKNRRKQNENKSLQRRSLIVSLLRTQFVHIKNFSVKKNFHSNTNNVWKWCFVSRSMCLYVFISIKCSMWCPSRKSNYKMQTN